VRGGVVAVGATVLAVGAVVAGAVWAGGWLVAVTAGAWRAGVADAGGGGAGVGDGAGVAVRERGVGGGAGDGVAPQPAAPATARAAIVCKKVRLVTAGMS
jgi:hypothetical protein